MIEVGIFWAKTFLNFFKIGVDKSNYLCYNILHGTESKVAGVAELADARDLKSRDTKVSYRFETGHRHHPWYKYRGVEQLGSSSGS